MEHDSQVRTFFVPGTPVGMPRQRFTARYSGKAGKFVPTAYRDSGHAVHSFKQAIQFLASQHFSTSGLSGWLRGSGVCYRVLCVCLMPEVSGISKKRTGYLPHAKKPDGDNILKAVKDALTGIAWDDDGAVFESQVVKFYVKPGERSGVHISIQAISGKLQVTDDGLKSIVNQWALAGDYYV